MREIKFRAWDGKDLLSWEQIKHWEAGWLNGGGYMQYTGLKDKNGKEIYEGDVLTPAEELLGGGVENQVVEWSSHGFWKGFVNYAKAEIIGNIYENPELNI